MNAKELAEKLNGRQYREEMTEAEEQLAKENNLIVIFGASDDLCEIRGAAYGEIGCNDGGEVYFDKTGLIEAECEDSDCPHEAKRQEEAHMIEILWCDERDISWTYKTDLPHATFDILEDEEKYCRGIVFSMEDLK